MLNQGASALADLELLTLLVGTGASGASARSVAAGLLDHCGCTLEMARAGPHYLAHQHGVGPAKATRIAAGIELGRRIMLRELGEIRQPMNSFESVVHWATPRLAHLDHEEVWALFLDGRNALRSARRVAQGGTHGCSLTARDVLRPALREGASGLLLIHNHPSGDPKPSHEDLAMTHALADACSVVGLVLVDHVVVARGGATSLCGGGALMATTAR